MTRIPKNAFPAVKTDPAQGSTNPSVGVVLSANPSVGHRCFSGTLRELTPRGKNSCSTHADGSANYEDLERRGLAGRHFGLPRCGIPCRRCGILRNTVLAIGIYGILF